MVATKNSATYWEVNCEGESMQRIYGISFPHKKLMKEWKPFKEEAAKQDHRKIGMQKDRLEKCNFFYTINILGKHFFIPKSALFLAIPKGLQT